MLAAGQNADAKAELERIVADNLTRVSALNNLAWLLRGTTCCAVPCVWPARRAPAPRAAHPRNPRRGADCRRRIRARDRGPGSTPPCAHRSSLGIRYQLAMALAGQQRRRTPAGCWKELLAGDTRCRAQRCRGAAEEARRLTQAVSRDRGGRLRICCGPPFIRDGDPCPEPPVPHAPPSAPAC